MKYLISIFLFIDGVAAGITLERAYPSHLIHDKGWYLLTVGQYICYAAIALVLLSIKRKSSLE